VKTDQMSHTTASANCVAGYLLYLLNLLKWKNTN
jgi:hypothetical protein